MERKGERQSVGVILATYLLRYLSDNRDLLGVLATMPASLLMNPTPAVGELQQNMRDALAAMAAANVPVLPVVAGGGSRTLVSALAPWHLMLLAGLGTNAEFNAAVANNVADFLMSVEGLLGAPTTTPTVRATDTYGTVLELMVAAAVPAVCVVTDDNQLVGAITHLDMIRAARPPLGGLTPTAPPTAPFTPSAPPAQPF